MPPGVVTIDVEATNRCNAKCHFCPRDATPHQGLMGPEVFSQVLARVIELRETTHDLLKSEFKLSFCGLGEPLLNPKTPKFVREGRDEGFTCVMSSNGSILDERRGRALLDAGLQQININVGDEGEDYERVYKLPYEKTRDNVLRFAEMARDQCEVNIVLVDYRRDRSHVKKMVRYWRQYGLDKFVFFDIMNRGGTLFVDDMQYESFPERAQAKQIFDSKGGKAFCGIPFVNLFVGYDGQYYLCCSDWTKQTPMGSVFDKSFMSVTRQKLQHVTSREPVCKTCNCDPVNRLTDTLREVAAGEADEAQRDEYVDNVLEMSQRFLRMIDQAGPLIDAPSTQAVQRTTRKLIPVSAD